MRGWGDVVAGHALQTGLQSNSESFISSLIHPFVFLYFKKISGI